jgi:tight adherence protein B
MLTAPMAPMAPMALSAAVLCWPYRPARARVAVFDPSRPARGRLRNAMRRPSVAIAATVGCGIGLVTAGPAGAIATALAAATVVSRWRARRREARSLAVVADLAAVLGLLTAELRAGAHPATAAERAASDAGPVTAAALTSVATTARLCGDVPQALRREAQAVAALQQPLDQLAAAWTLAERHGIPLADVLDTVRGDLDHRVRARRRLHASLAGPRATAAVLACLPVLGLLLGQAVGGQPWRVLTESAAGQALLVLGVLLICAGLSWSARLVAGATP